MVINNTYLEFNLYDEDKADVKERYFSELAKMSRISKDMPSDGTEKEKNEYLCMRIKSFFDNIFGAGTGVDVCGAGNDRLVHLTAYTQLVKEQMRQDEEYRTAMEFLKNVGKSK